MGQTEVETFLKRYKKPLPAREIAKKMRISEGSLNNALVKLCKWKRIKVINKKVRCGKQKYLRDVRYYKLKG